MMALCIVLVTFELCASGSPEATVQDAAPFCKEVQSFVPFVPSLKMRPDTSKNGSRIQPPDRGGTLFIYTITEAGIGPSDVLIPYVDREL